MSLFRN